jgi:hypothetical protein
MSMLLPWYPIPCPVTHRLLQIRAAEDLLSVTRKLRQLWILSDSAAERESKNGMEDRLDVSDVSKGLQRILRIKESNEEMRDVRHDTNDPEEMIT